MDLVLDLFCRLSPAIGAAAFVFIALVALVAWRGGTIDKIKIPGLFEIALREPIVVRGSRLLLAVAGIAGVFSVGLATLQFGDTCTRCVGLPGETAWIYGGHADRNGKFDQGPYFSGENGVKALDVRPGTWITLLSTRRTMILDYDTQGTKRAMDSPFGQGKVVYTCKTLAAGDRLYVADRRFRGPDPDDQHLWFRIRRTAIGG